VEAEKSQIQASISNQRKNRKGSSTSGLGRQSLLQGKARRDESYEKEKETKGKQRVLCLKKGKAKLKRGGKTQLGREPQYVLVNLYQKQGKNSLWGRGGRT